MFLDNLVTHYCGIERGFKMLNQIVLEHDDEDLNIAIDEHSCTGRGEDAPEEIIGDLIEEDGDNKS